MIGKFGNVIFLLIALFAFEVSAKGSKDLLVQPTFGLHQKMGETDIYTIEMKDYIADVFYKLEDKLSANNFVFDLEAKVQGEEAVKINLMNIKTVKGNVSYFQNSVKKRCHFKTFSKLKKCFKKIAK
jgi:hypothetical protein